MIKLGHEVRHVLSGIEGIVTAKSEALNGTVQFCVTPEGVDKDGNSRESKWHDEPFLTKRNDMLHINVIEPQDCDIMLGDEVVEALSGFEGTAEEQLTYVNGCVVIAVRPKALKKNDFPDVKYINSLYLKVKTKKAVKVKTDKSGGPSSMAPTRD